MFDIVDVLILIGYEHDWFSCVCCCCDLLAYTAVVGFRLQILLDWPGRWRFAGSVNISEGTGIILLDGLIMSGCTLASDRHDCFPYVHGCGGDLWALRVMVSLVSAQKAAGRCFPAETQNPQASFGTPTV